MPAQFGFLVVVNDNNRHCRDIYDAFGDLLVDGTNQAELGQQRSYFLFDKWPKGTVAGMLQIADSDADHLFKRLPRDHCNASEDAVMRSGLLDSIEDRLDVLCSVCGSGGVCCCHIGSLKMAIKSTQQYPDEESSKREN